MRQAMKLETKNVWVENHGNSCVQQKPFSLFLNLWVIKVRLLDWKMCGLLL
jgi:hypothetical protein